MASTAPLVSNPSEDGGPKVLAVGITTTTIAVAVMATRMVVRVRMIHNVGIDDWIMLLVTLISITGCGVVIAEVVAGGVGKHMGDIPPAMIAVGMKLNLVTQQIFLWGICLAKMSVGAALYRIASTKIWKNTILGTMIFVFTYTSIAAATILTQCTDIRIIWDPTVEATCWPSHQIQLAGYINFVFNILTDLTLALAFPLLMLWNINVNLRTKLSLFFVLGLGCVVTACAIVRLFLLPTYGASGDWLFDTVNLAMWSSLELNVSIFAGSLPSLRPLFKRILGGIGYGSGTNNKNTLKKSGTYGPGDGAGGAGVSRSRTTSKWRTTGGMPGGTDTKHSKGRKSLTGTSRVADDGESQRQLHDLESMASTDVLDSPFELTSYKAHAVEVTCEPVPRSPSDRFVATGITRTDHITVTYDKR